MVQEAVQNMQVLRVFMSLQRYGNESIKSCNADRSSLLAFVKTFSSVFRAGCRHTPMIAVAARIF